MVRCLAVDLLRSQPSMSPYSSQACIRGARCLGSHNIVPAYSSALKIKMNGLPHRSAFMLSYLCGSQAGRGYAGETHKRNPSCWPKVFGHSHRSTFIHRLKLPTARQSSSYPRHHQNLPHQRPSRDDLDQVLRDEPDRSPHRQLHPRRRGCAMSIARR